MSGAVGIVVQAAYAAGAIVFIVIVTLVALPPSLWDRVAEQRANRPGFRLYRTLSPRWSPTAWHFVVTAVDDEFESWRRTRVGAWFAAWRHAR